MNPVHFTVYGEPRGKGRPRFATRGKYAKAYTPHDTVLYENLVRTEFKQQCGDVFFDREIPLRMEVAAYLTIPSSASKKKKADMASGKLRPLKKVDSSNILKAVEDALNTVAYHDDVQIVETVVNRWYGEIPRVEVTITQLS